MNSSIQLYRRATVLALLLSPALPACGDVAEPLAASSIESALCRGERCDGRGGAEDAGVRGGACQEDADCGPGFECEEEHGQRFCEAHAADEADDDHGGDESTGSADAGSPASCSTSADCVLGERCESIGGGRRACFSGEQASDRSGPNRGRH